MPEQSIDKLAFIEIKDRKVLVTLSRGKDTWYIPGGKRESGESDHDALVREVQEELSLQLDPNTITFYGIFEAQAHGKPKGTKVKMTCYLAQYQGMPVAASEIEALDYFTHQQNQILCGPVDHLIFDDLRSKGLID